MADYLTSFIWKNVDLNDARAYLMPLEDNALDDRASVEASWATRKGAVPVQTSTAIKEGVFNLNIQVVASSPFDFEQKLDTLKAIFDTRDPAFYPLRRRLPIEGEYSYINAAPRELAVNRKLRRVSITMQTADKSWLAETEQTLTATLFAGAPRTETIVFTYNGLSPVEPTIEFTTVTPGSDGPTPLYYRDVAVWAVNGAQVVGTPIKIVSGWDTSALVSGGKMRSDGLDIAVELNGVQQPRLVTGSAGARAVWVKPDQWPAWSELVVQPYPGQSFSDPAVTSAHTAIYISAQGRVIDIPASATIALDNEYITYSAWAYTNTEHTMAVLTGCTRGVFSTTPANHGWYTRVKQALLLRITYGYAAGYTVYFNNNVANWPLLDYENSTNAEWVQNQNWDQSGLGNRPLSWYGNADPRPKRLWQSIAAAADPTETGSPHLALYGLYNPGVNYKQAAERLAWFPYGYTSRQVSSMRVKLSLASAAAPLIVRLLKIRSGFGTYNEDVRDMWSTTVAATTVTTADSGNIYLDHWNYPGEAYVLRIDSVGPGGTETRMVRLDEVRLQIDTDFGRNILVGGLSSEGGPGTSEYPVSVVFRNLTTDVPAFTVLARKTTGQVLTVNAEARTVTNLRLTDCSYKQPEWLKLVPGQNTIQVTGPTGSGQIAMTLRWKERY